MSESYIQTVYKMVQNKLWPKWWYLQVLLQSHTVTMAQLRIPLLSEPQPPPPKANGPKANGPQFTKDIDTRILPIKAPSMAPSSVPPDSAVALDVELAEGPGPKASIAKPSMAPSSVLPDFAVAPDDELDVESLQVVLHGGEADMEMAPTRWSRRFRLDDCQPRATRSPHVLVKVSEDIVRGFNHLTTRLVAMERQLDKLDQLETELHNCERQVHTSLRGANDCLLRQQVIDVNMRTLQDTCERHVSLMHTDMSLIHRRMENQRDTIDAAQEETDKQIWRMQVALLTLAAFLVCAVARLWYGFLGGLASLLGS